MTSSIRIQEPTAQRTTSRRLLMTAAVVAGAAVAGVAATSVIDGRPDISPARSDAGTFVSSAPLAVEAVPPTEAAFLGGDAQNTVTRGYDWNLDPAEAAFLARTARGGTADSSVVATHSAELAFLAGDAQNTVTRGYDWNLDPAEAAFLARTARGGTAERVTPPARGTDSCVVGVPC